jgi:peptide/nickel transport system permease protein
VRTARAKGLSDRIVTYKHALRNALISVVTVVGLQMGYRLGGTVIVEQVFAYPGLGRLSFQALLQRDYPMVMGNLLMFAVLFSLINILVDLTYAWVDPRIRYE